jgi:hypothetical protein
MNPELESLILAYDAFLESAMNEDQRQARLKCGELSRESLLSWWFTLIENGRGSRTPNPPTFRHRLEAALTHRLSGPPAGGRQSGGRRGVLVGNALPGGFFAPIEKTTQRVGWYADTPGGGVNRSPRETESVIAALAQWSRTRRHHCCWLSKVRGDASCGRAGATHAPCAGTVRGAWPSTPTRSIIPTTILCLSRN